MVQVYVLDAREVHDVRLKGFDDYTFFAEHEMIPVSDKLNIESLETEIKGWTRLDNCFEYARPEDFDTFFEIRKNRREVGELIRYWTFGKVELDDGSWVVHITEYERDYYLLDINQVESLKQMIEK